MSWKRKKTFYLSTSIPSSIHQNQSFILKMCIDNVSLKSIKPTFATFWGRLTTPLINWILFGCAIRWITDDVLDAWHFSNWFWFSFFLFNWFLSQQIGKGVGVERKDGRVTVRHFTASTRFPLPRPVVQEQLGFPNLQVSLEKCIFLLPGATKSSGSNRNFSTPIHRYSRFSVCSPNALTWNYFGNCWSCSR